MLLIGLTGSISTGKSTVSTLLTAPPHSLPLIDADVLARNVVEPGTSGYRRIIEYFGPSTPDLLLPPAPPIDNQEVDGGNSRRHAEDGGKERPLNRVALGRRVFGDTAEKRKDRAVLNGIIHPAVRWEIYKALVYYYVRGFWAVVLDVPLLFESGLDLICGTVVVVAVRDVEVQMRRLLERDKAQGGEMTREEAEGRVKSQSDVREKAERCERRNDGLFGQKEEGRGLIIWNNGNKEELKKNVAEVMEKMRQNSPLWWSWICLLVPPVGLAAGAWQMTRSLIDKWAWERQQKVAKVKL